MDEIIIRNAEESDVNCISVLATQVWLDTYVTENRVLGKYLDV